MAVGIFNPTVTSDATVYAQNAVYATARDAASGTVFTAGYIWAGQYLSGGNYEVARTALFFDTSSLGAGAVISAVTLQLKGQADLSVTDFDLIIVSGDDLTDRLVSADYGDMLDNTTSYGSLGTSGWVLEDWNTITLNATGRAAISLTGITKFGFRSSRDINSNIPTGDEEVFFYSGAAFANEIPILTITYTPAFISKVFIL